MLALKLFLVPTFLALITIASQRWGAKVGGWLAGFPVVAGPILLILALERGHQFAAQAATTSLAAVCAAVIFGVAYAWLARRCKWIVTLPVALLAWLAAALVLSVIATNLTRSLIAACFALVVAPWCFPINGMRLEPGDDSSEAKQVVAPKFELFARMVAGVLVTLSVTLTSDRLGPLWSGMLAVFPTMGSVLAVFSHIGRGPVYTTTLLRAMSTGFWSITAFMTTLALCFRSEVSALTSISCAFSLALLAALSVQLMTRHVSMVDRK